MLKVSFDFDSTLDTPEMQELAKKLIKQGCEVWITTTRTLFGSNFVSNNEDVFRIASELGIRNQIQFTNYEDKYEFVTEFDLHFDDDEHEVDLINAHPSKCIGIIFKKPNKNHRIL